MTDADVTDSEADARSPVDDSAENGPGATNAEAIDWAALWEEFGFDTPDANGDLLASRTQLQAALEASDQDISGDAEQQIDDAVDVGDLDEVTLDGKPVGYQHEVSR